MKSFDINTFSRSIAQFKIIPYYLNGLTAIIIPSVEIVCGIALILNIFRITIIKESGIYVLLLMMSFFTLGIAINLIKGNIFDCNCFGALNLFSKISIEKIFFNLFIMILLFLLVKKESFPLVQSNKLTNLFILTISISMLLNIPIYNNQLNFSINEKMVKEIPVHRAIEQLKEDKTILIDVRESTKYIDSHIPLAISLPFSSINGYNNTLSTIDKSQKILLYCDSKICGRSMKAAILLLKMGYKNIEILKGGYKSWKDYEKSMN